MHNQLLKKFRTCNKSVLFPTPGSPPTKTKEPETGKCQCKSLKASIKKCVLTCRGNGISTVQQSTSIWKVKSCLTEGKKPKLMELVQIAPMTMLTHPFDTKIIEVPVNKENWDKKDSLWIQKRQAINQIRKKYKGSKPGTRPPPRTLPTSAPNNPDLNSKYLL